MPMTQTADTELFVHVLLLDADQLRVIRKLQGACEAASTSVVALDGAEFIPGQPKIRVLDAGLLGGG